MEEKELYLERKEKVKDVIYSPEYKPMKYKELAFLFQLTEDEKPVLSQILNELTEEGRIVKTPRGKYQRLDAGILCGTFTGNNRGFGFVTVEGDDEDYFIPEKACNGALHMDTVLMRVTNAESSAGRRREGEITRILSHGIKELVGTFDPGKGYGFVIPDNQKFNQDIFIPKALTKGAVRGHKVVVQITDYGNKNQKPEGRITEILGHINDPGTDVISIVKAYDLPVEFPDMVMRQAERTPEEPDAKDYAGRKDLRDWMTVTIDGDDAKDLDDAITLRKTEDGYELGVHIADVSEYVTEHSPLDEEALTRGTSVYLVDRVIPMLPHRLSNGICSLNQGTDRLALSCIMQINEKGNVVHHEITETVIRVDRRMSYANVNKILEQNDEAVKQEYAEFLPMFYQMKELADILRKKRDKRGSIDFDFPETQIILDEKGFPVDIRPYERLTANKIIEDFMLLANETVAEDYFWQELPFVYRTHESPDPDRIRKLGILVSNFGYCLKANPENIHPKEFQKLLERISDSPEEAMISRLTLRSMKQAKYSTICYGHFGLATHYYCHFTSPIRRYPDLQIHRIIKENLHGKLSDKRITHYEKILPEVSESCSKLERRADEVEREVEKMKKVQYMSRRIGECYEGVISGVNAWGMYVELPNTVEGLVHVTNMVDDYYYYDEEKYAMIGKDTGKEYTLGEKVWVMVKAADRISKTIDFILVQNMEE
ncbi:MAG: ribonuclease R [Clostridium sp.]|jgi:ribonuclease R|nr:ribonuclease R [Clostridium sp.]